MTINLPPMPVANDFRDDTRGNVHLSYYDALRVWKEVCLALTSVKFGHIEVMSFQPTEDAPSLVIPKPGNKDGEW